VQTKFVILASIFGVISALSFSTNQNILLSLSAALIASALYLAAYLSKDKKDEQIEEIHRITTNTELKSHLAKEIKPTSSTEGTKQSLSKTHEEVLNLLFKEPTEIKNICKTLNLSTEEVKYYLDDLRKIDMVSMPPIYPAGPGNWSIGQNGREYIMAKKRND